MFEKLFSPLQIGPVSIENRIQITPHELSYLSDGLVTDTMVDYYEERAKGGVALLEVSQLTTKAPNGFRMPEWQYDNARRFPFVSGPEIVPGLRRLADAVHVHGAKIFMEIASRTYNYGPVSSLPLEGGEHLKEMTKEKITEVEQAFRQAAGYVKQAGFDGVDLHGTHGNMIEHFYSPVTNRRDDEYGGSLHNRLRFLLEVIDLVRDEVGDRMALGMRLCADERIEGGIDPEHAAKIAAVLDGKLDFINLDSGSFNNFEALNQHALQTQPLYVDPGYGLYMSEPVMKVAKRTRIGVAGRIADPLVADSIIEKGQADYVGMTRALIADPELPRKAREGRLEEIRPCIATAQDCWGRSVAHEWPMRCTVNPSVGLEATRGAGRLGKADTAKKVLIIGAGVAGLEAARIAAERGHEVVVYEKGSVIGGQVNLAKKFPGRSDIGAVVGWYEAEMRRLGVRLELRKEVTSEAEARYLVETEEPDAVVLAVGSTPIRSGLQMVTFDHVEGWDRPNVRTVDEVLSTEPMHGDIVVADSTTYIAGPGTAEFLSRRGASVTLVTPHPHLSPDLSAYNQLIHVTRRLRAARVRVVPFSWVRRIGPREVTIFDIPTGEEEEVTADHVVLNTGRRQSDDQLARYFSGLVPDVREVGDCQIAGRTIRAAINSAYEAAAAL
jgi:2,4-dienoyl-CoA reductase-like NADH-dependent reductase (Old Yellow Enzyme family)/thioredoxin reductase